jgi:hypothetical protein
VRSTVKKNKHKKSPAAQKERYTALCSGEVDVSEFIMDFGYLAVPLTPTEDAQLKEQLSATLPGCNMTVVKPHHLDVALLKEEWRSHSEASLTLVEVFIDPRQHTVQLGKQTQLLVARAA